MSEPSMDYARAEPGGHHGAIESLREATHYLHDRIDILHTRLGGVLEFDSPMLASDRAEVAKPDIQALVEEVQRAAGRVDNLVSRLVI
ncbi:MAG TPA: hypothetical protein VGF24_37260 [Vicinamibacterales bacterium]|jgi:hypothetical protein